MKIGFGLLILFFLAAAVQADDQIARAQEQLKDQGFYYGQITGEKNAETIAAIRRFQIRSGLQITGELNDETLKALTKAPSSANRAAVAAGATPPSPPARVLPPAPRQDEANLRADPGTESQDSEAAAEGPVSPSRSKPLQVYPSQAVPSNNGNFVRTPYENSAPDVQQDVIAHAERTLARRELYRGPIDGVFNSDLEFSLRAYQARVRLPTTGRLDLQTLAALELLPGATQPVFVPHRAYPQTPVHGEWVRP